MQKHDLAKRPLRVGRAAERIEDLLERDGLAVAAVYGAPHDTVSLFVCLFLQSEQGVSARGMCPLVFCPRTRFPSGSGSMPRSRASLNLFFSPFGFDLSSAFALSICPLARAFSFSSLACSLFLAGRDVPLSRRAAGYRTWPTRSGQCRPPTGLEGRRSFCFSTRFASRRPDNDLFFLSKE